VRDDKSHGSLTECVTRATVDKIDPDKHRLMHIHTPTLYKRRYQHRPATDTESTAHATSHAHTCTSSSLTRTPTLYTRRSQDTPVTDTEITTHPTSHAYTCTSSSHTRTDTHTQVHRLYAYMCITHIIIYLKTHTHTHTHKHSHTHSHIHSHIHIHSLTVTHTCTNTDTRPRMHTDARHLSIDWYL
jgi:hypothetical protein